MLFLMVLGASLAYSVITSFGYVTVQDVKFYGASGNIISAHLFIPSGATAQTQKPGILAIHGYNNQKDFMTNTAMELARRGYVVLSIDMTGHGFSEGNVGAFSYGATDGLNYLRNLAYVNKSNIGLVGMSMGGWAIQAAALASPDNYTAMFYMDSYPTTPQMSLLKNVAVQMGFADEFTPSWLRVNTGSEIPNATILKTLCGTTEPVVPGQVYGSIENGTARIVYVPYIDHPQSTDHPASIANVIEWFGMTLKGGEAIPKDNLIFPWKIFFTSISFVAAIGFIFTFGGYLLQKEYFKNLVRPLPEYKGFKGIGYWIAAVITTAVGPLLYLYGWTNLGANTMLTNVFMPMTPLNRYMAWMNLVALVTLALLLAFYYISLRKTGINEEHIGLLRNARKIGKSLVFAAITLIPIYVTLAYCYGIFKVPFTLGGLMIPIVLRPMNDTRFFFMFPYFLTLLPFYLMHGVLFAGFIRYKNGNVSLVKEMLINSIILSAGSIALLLYYYIPLYAGMPQTLWDFPGLSGTPPLPMIYFVPIPVFSIIEACVLTYFYRKTGNIWPGVLLMTLFMTWYHVAFTVFHIPALA